MATAVGLLGSRRQRIALARTLLGDPAVRVLGEAMRALGGAASQARLAVQDEMSPLRTSLRAEPVTVALETTPAHCRYARQPGRGLAAR
ncbi:MAG: hypothetical protein IT305_25765 [Chloroflexi bacterium]|nr:hypothetical protein [Chloroflexota bacterium]